jgi:hypothetical protein
MAKQRFWLNPKGGPEFLFGSTAAASRYFKRHHNVEQGFYDSKGVFHPIRASRDYSASRAGEGRHRKSRKSKKRRRR